MLLRKLSLAALGLALAAAASARAEQPADKLVPPDSEMVMTFNVRQALESPLAKKYVLDELKKALKSNDEAQKVLTAMGLDPLKDIDTAVITFNKLDANPKPGIIAARGKFDLDKIAAVGAEAAKTGDLKIHKEGKLTVYEGKGDEPVFFTFTDKNTVVAAMKKDYLLEAIGGKIKPGKNLKDLQAAMAMASGKESITTVVILNDEIKAQLKGNPQTAQLAGKLQSVTMAVTLTNEADLKLAINTADAATAMQVSMTIKQFIPLAKILIQGQENIPPFVGELIDKVKIGTDKSSVTIGLVVDAATIEKAAKLVKP